MDVLRFLFILFFLVSCRPAFRYHNLTSADIKISQTSPEMTRPKYKKIVEEVGAASHEVTSEMFVVKFLEALSIAHRFASSDEIGTNYHVSDWEIRSSDLVDFYKFTRNKMSALPKFYVFEDVFTYSRFVALWQSGNKYKVIQLSSNNDNSTIYWGTGEGEYKFRPGAQKIREISTEQEFQKLIFNEFESRKTIYPHIEKYEICIPKCNGQGLFGIAENVVITE